MTAPATSPQETQRPSAETSGAETSGAKTSGAEAPKAKAPGAGHGYIVSPLYDCVFFLYSPLMALMLGLFVTRTSLEDEWNLFGKTHYLSSFLLRIFIHAHLFLVFARSHGNPEVFKRHPWRFTLVPVLLLIAMQESMWILVCGIVVGIWWDVYHSGMQTFGLGRIYDMKAGNDPELGRDLDRGLNLLLYVGPILAGQSLISHLDGFDSFKQVQSALFVSIPGRVMAYQMPLRWGVIAAGLLYTGYFLWRLRQLMSEGYTLPPQKAILYTSTGLCSIYAWGFNPAGQAFFIMNFFHALQYFAIVWWAENKNLQARLGLESMPSGRWILLFLFVTVPILYGSWVQIRVSMESSRLFFSLALVVSLMHFWYDGFIWSVRKKQVG